MGGNLADTVYRATVKAGETVRLCLETDTDMFDGTRDDTVSYARKGAGEIVLAVAQLASGIEIAMRSITGGELATSIVKGTELDGHLRR